MNIVFLSHEYPLWATGGAGTFLQTFGRALVAAGHKVTVLGVGKVEEEVRMEDQGVRLIRLRRNRSIVPNFLYNSRVLNKRLKQLHQEDPIDIIEAAELGLGIISRKHTARKVIRLHGGHHFFAEAENRGINWRKGTLEKASFSKADGFIAVSEYVKTHTAKYLSYHGKPVAIINHPIQMGIHTEEKEIRANRILFAGTVCEKKGVRQLIEAFGMVKIKHPQMILDLYGRDWFYPDGSSYIEMLRTNFTEKELENIIFHGPVDRDMLNEKYAEAAFCVFPSHMETQGLVSLEAMLVGKPVIFSKYGPGPETIEHGETGLLCDVYDPKDIAEKMNWCIEHPMEAKELGDRAQIHVRTKYDPTTILNKNLEFYDKLLKTTK